MSQERAKGMLIHLVWKSAPTVVPRKRKVDMVGNNWNINAQFLFSVAESTENVCISLSGEKRRNPFITSAGEPSA